ncbi:putative BTB/POZ domain-containing protein At3g08660 [Raphanus sativus]|uniref:BTB/POZ domain-containing protein At3g08660 n=1 Tax=Raphanus sativus TaxID=3726 RepID=A0A6J0NNF2_RAPSA|nr:putative BTB/POZ domain-containing protein At3g08660 [Raphanus sativus]
MAGISNRPLSLSSSSSTSSTPCCNSRSSVPPPTFSTCIFSDVGGDVTVVVDGESFLLHKFPLVARCGKIRKIMRDLKDSSSCSTIELRDFPGGPLTFELAMKFCYGINLEITPSNVVELRCAAGYLEMTEEYKEDNLIARTESYLDKTAFRNLKKSVQVLTSCEAQELSETFKIPDRCVEAIAMNACREQLVSGFSEELKGRDCLAWWIEQLSALGIDYYTRVVSVMARTGVRSESIIASLMHYSQETLKCIVDGNSQEKREIVEAIVTLLPSDERGSIIPLSFLLGMLKIGITLDIEVSYRLELESRIGQQLESVSLDDLLIPNSVGREESVYDVDTVHRILTCFLERVDEEEDEESGYDSDSTGHHHGSLLKVGRIMDAYLAEIAPDPYLSLHKFTAIIERLPDYARILDDGIYRAIDVYLKAHPLVTEEERKSLCKFIDCNKLSQEASNHMAQNDRLPVQMVVRVLYSEQLRMKKALSGDSDEGVLDLSSGVLTRAVSPRDNYASLRRENRELKLEIARMRVRVSELEKEQMLMKQGMLERSGNSGGTFLTSLSKGIGKIGLFGGENRHKVNRKSRSVSERKTSRKG